MQTQITSKTGTGSSSPLVINTNTTPVNVGFAVVVSGTVNYTVQHTYDNPNGTLPHGLTIQVSLLKQRIKMAHTLCLSLRLELLLTLVAVLQQCLS